MNRAEFDLQVQMTGEFEPRPPAKVLVEHEKSMRIINDSAPVEPRQATYLVGKLLCWSLSRGGTWAGVISRDGFRWTFGGRDIICKENELVEGQQVSFRSRLHENFQGLGCADMVKPSAVQSQPPSQPPQQVSENELLQSMVERTLPPTKQQSQPEEMYGLVMWWGDESREGFLEADGIRYKFSARDVIRGIPAQGLMARFGAVAATDGDLPHAIAVELA